MKAGASMNKITPPSKSENPTVRGVRNSLAKTTSTRTTVSLFNDKLVNYGLDSESFNYVVDLAKDALTLIDSPEDYSEILQQLETKPGFTAGIFRHLKQIAGKNENQQIETFRKLLPYLNLKGKKTDENTKNNKYSEKHIYNLIMYRCPQGVVNLFVTAVNKDPENGYQNFSDKQKKFFNKLMDTNNRLAVKQINFTDLKAVLGISADKLIKS